MKIILLVIFALLQTSCSIRIGDSKVLKGGVIEYMEKYYDTASRTPMVGGVMYINMKPSLYLMVERFCDSKGNIMLDNWCVDTKGYPLFRVSYDAVGTVPVAVNGSMLMMNGGSGWLSIIERSSTQTDREWLDVAKDTYHFQSQK